jgi:uncharacterized protein (DUF362 family)
MKPVDFRRAPKCPGGFPSRRDFLRTVAAAALVPAASATPPHSVLQAGLQVPPRGLTSIGLCKRYGFAEVRGTLARMLDELGTVRGLVKGKHVTVKVNLVNTSREHLDGVPLWMTVTVHPAVAMALGSLLTDYGARQITYVDQLPFRELDEAAFAGYGFDAKSFNDVMDGRARFVNTRNRGAYAGYAVVRVPGGGDLASAWEVNRQYTETDVLVSLGKLKSHVSGGVTGGMKNLFGIPPSSLYGDDLKDHPDEDAADYRNGVMHSCVKKPFTSADYFTGKPIQGDHGNNVPRFIVDLNAAFPIHLTVLDAISTIQTAEGWWLGSMVSVTRPGLLVAGVNPVSTDAVAAAVMGFNPEAADRTHPFANGINYLSLARQRGLGENRMKELEVAGLGLEAARFEYQPTYRRIRP